MLLFLINKQSSQAQQATPLMHPHSYRDFYEHRVPFIRDLYLRINTESGTIMKYFLLHRKDKQQIPDS
jgi:hypothetical protein